MCLSVKHKTPIRIGAMLSCHYQSLLYFMWVEVLEISHNAHLATVVC